MSQQPIPTTIEYGGDEISALVLDPGTSWTRAGFAGEDIPKRVISSEYGELASEKEGEAPSYFFGENDLHRIRGGMEVKNPMGDGIVQDWDHAPAVWKAALMPQLTTALEEHPLIVTEPAWNPTRNREKTAETIFDSFSSPAFYLAKSAVCTAFAAGKATALVIDFGAANISVTPVVDGLVLKKGVSKTPLGGDFLNHQLRAYFAMQQPPIQLIPHVLVQSKVPVDANQPAQAILRSIPVDQRQPTQTWRRYAEDRVLQEFKETVVQTWTSQTGTLTDANAAVVGGARPFEFPDGYNRIFGPDRFRIAETIWQPQLALNNPNEPLPFELGSVQPLQACIKESLSNVDQEVRHALLQCIVVTGGGSLLYGFTERLNAEVSLMNPSLRVRINASGNTMERKFGAWLGGSILASLGTFHQLWVSKREYEEHGPNIVEKRCK